MPANKPSLEEIVAVWTMAFGEPPVVRDDGAMLLAVLRAHFPHVAAILGDEAELAPAA